MNANMMAMIANVEQWIKVEDENPQPIVLPMPILQDVANVEQWIKVEDENPQPIVLPMPPLLQEVANVEQGIKVEDENPQPIVLHAPTLTTFAEIAAMRRLRAPAPLAASLAPNSAAPLPVGELSSVLLRLREVQVALSASVTRSENVLAELRALTGGKVLRTLSSP